MLAEIITIGDELLIGQVTDTNSTWIAQQLNLIGIEVKQFTTISDHKWHIHNALDQAKSRADLIITTGGLGPTNDDMTKPVFCEYFNTKLVLNEECLKDIENLFTKRGYPMTELNRKQAEVPVNCIPIRNFNGTAPGMWFEEDDKVFISLPGVPFEMKAMFEDTLLEKIVEHFKPQAIFHKTILTQGIGESFLAEKIADWENALPQNIKLAYLPSPGIVRLRLSTKGENKDKLKENIEEQIEKLKKIIPDNIYGYDTDTIEQVVGDLLRKSEKTLSTAESCTGGYIAHKITSISGSSDYYKGSVIAYSNEVKENILGVNKDYLIKHGAVSEKVATEMAIKVRQKLNTDYSIAVTGIAGPTGGTEEKPVGTVWVAVSSKEKTYAKKFILGDNRERFIIRTAIIALNMLRDDIIRN